MKLKLGTRKSKLALAQSRFVARQLESLHENLTIELVGIETQADESRGDQYSKLPLAELDGKNFFIKELDEALIDGRTDLSVHSYKDLSLDRPSEITLAAIPTREHPHDIIVMSKAGMQKLNNGEGITLGSSSPRRVENTPKALAETYNSEITMTPIRGNINTRINRIHKTDDDYVDGVVLALAGLLRLIRDDEFGMGFADSLNNAEFLLVPLLLSPTAPGQGALAIECRSSDVEVQKTINTLHHDDTAFEVKKEREILAQYGGGCHQAFGATCILDGGTQTLYIRGKSEQGKLLDETQGSIQANQGEVKHFRSWNKLLRGLG